MSSARARGYLCALHPRSLHGWCSDMEKFVCRRFYRQEGATECVFFSTFFLKRTVAFTHSSCLIYYGSPLRKCAAGNAEERCFLFSPPMFSETYGSQDLSWIYDYMCRKHNTHKTEIPLCCFQACWGYIKMKQMTSLPSIIHIWGSNPI